MRAGRCQTVHVHQSPRGGWEVSLRDQHASARVETLEAARRLAHLWAAGGRPCELIVHDAYHRVLEYAVVDGVELAGRAAD